MTWRAETIDEEEKKTVPHQKEHLLIEHFKGLKKKCIYVGCKDICKSNYLDL
jgi:hypothetical protein